MSPKSRTALAVTLAVTGMTLFSSKVLLAKAAYRHGIPALDLLALRMMWALPFFLAIAFYDLRSAQRRPTRRDIAFAGLAGLMGYYVASLLDFIAIQFISPALERMILLLYPTAVLLLGAAFLKKRITARLMSATAIGYFGIIIMIREEFQLALGPGDRPLLGAGLVALSAVAYASSIVGGESVMKRMGSRSFTSLAMPAGCIGCIIHFLLARGIQLPTGDPALLGIGAAMGLFCTVVPSYLINYAIRCLGGHTVGVMGYVGVGISFVLSALLLGERFSPLKITGIAIAGLGAFLVLQLQRRHAVAPAPAPAGSTAS